MLSQISISNYTIVSSLDMEFAGGMTVITGETGAGKSIMLDALGLCLGDRADTKALRPGAERADITAGFDISNIPAAQHWLRERDLFTGEECLLRRVITAEGRSRAYINGSASTLQDCAELGALLVDIHSQHAHQSLLRRSTQRALLDAYAGHAELTAQVEQTASDWLRKGRELELLTGANDERSARVQLLRYQVEELDTLALGPDELATLEGEVKLLANAESILTGAHQALELSEAGETSARQALRLLRDETHATTAAGDARELLESAAIQLEEARSSIARHLDSVEVDPARLAEVQGRLESIYDVARKHKVMPERLPELHAGLGEELQNLEAGGARIESLQAEMRELAAAYDTLATRLTRQRGAAAKKLTKATTAILNTLAMENCRLEIALNPVRGDAPHPHGNEDVEILISTNPGAAPQGLGKIASGGELSRISLAIQVAAASAGTVPSMVFDEVDVGIGGAVAEVVGRLLRELSGKAQVLCVTHLPQVAAQGHQHLKVSKTSSREAVETRLARIEADDKVEEIARMLGGVKITQQTLAHAREMLESE